MPHQDAQGRWISDDGLQYWDGNAWRPTTAQAAPRRGISAVGQARLTSVRRCLELMTQ